MEFCICFEKSGSLGCVDLRALKAIATPVSSLLSLHYGVHGRIWHLAAETIIYLFQFYYELQYIFQALQLVAARLLPLAQGHLLPVDAIIWPRTPSVDLTQLEPAAQGEVLCCDEILWHFLVREIKVCKHKQLISSVQVAHGSTYEATRAFHFKNTVKASPSNAETWYVFLRLFYVIVHDAWNVAGT